MQRLSLVILLLLALTQSVSANTIRAEISSREVDLNLSFSVIYSISVFNPKSFNFIPETDDYQTIASSSGSSFEMINGKTTQSKIYKFVLKAKHEGIITIPPATAVTDQGTLASKALSINVRPAVQKNTPGGRSVSQDLLRQRPKVFAKASISKYKPYINEQINYKIKVYHRGNLRSLNFEPFDINDFVSKKDDKAKEYSEFVNGLEYLVYEINFILYPIKSGVLQIPKYEFKGSIIEDAPFPRAGFDPFRMMNSFFVEKEINLSTKALGVNVQALPIDAPDGFTGYVGDLVVNHEISSESVTIGDAINLQSKIYGNGNPKNLNLELVKESKQYTLYKDKEQSINEISKNQEYFETTTNYAIIPEKNMGKISIKLAPLVSFNPVSKKYEEHGAKEFTIDIQGNTALNSEEVTNTENNDNEAVKEKIKIEQVIPFTSKEVLNYNEGEAWSSNKLLILLALINIIALIISIYKFIQNKNSSVETLSLKEKKQIIRKANGLEDISKTIKELYQNSPPENSELSYSVSNFIDKCDQLNYGGAMSVSNDELESLRQQALTLIKDFNKKTRSPIHA